MDTVENEIVRNLRDGEAGVAGRHLRQFRRRGGDPRGQGRPRLGRERQGVHRLPARLRADAGRARASRGDRGGAGADRQGHDVFRQQPARHRTGRGDRRGGALRRAGALCVVRHRGRSLRDARRARLHPARQDPEIRGRLSRHERLFADVLGAETLRQFPDAGAGFGRHPEKRARRHDHRAVQ